MKTLYSFVEQRDLAMVLKMGLVNAEGRMKHGAALLPLIPTFDQIVEAERTLRAQLEIALQ